MHTGWQRPSSFPQAGPVSTLSSSFLGVRSQVRGESLAEGSPGAWTAGAVAGHGQRARRSLGHTLGHGGLPRTALPLPPSVTQTSIPEPRRSLRSWSGLKGAGVKIGGVWQSGPSSHSAGLLPTGVVVSAHVVSTAALQPLVQGLCPGSMFVQVVFWPCGGPASQQQPLIAWQPQSQADQVVSVCPPCYA